MPKLKGETILLDPTQSADFLLCMRYIQWVEWDRKDKGSFAEEIGVDRATLWRYTITWKETGLLVKARQYFWHIQSEDITIADRMAASEWPAAIKESLRLIKEAKSEYVRTMNIQWLYKEIVQPLMEAEEDPGAAEKAYLETILGNAKALDPMSPGRDPDDE